MLPVRSLLAAAAMLLPGLALAQQPAAVSRSMERTATVEAVDQRERSLVLRGEDGGLRTIFAGPAMRNFSQIRAGDRVVATYVEAVAVQLAKADGSPPVDAGAAVARTPMGDRPGGAAVEGRRIRVKIEGIDLGRNSVAFTGPQGARRELMVRDPAMRRFIRTLRPGDEVDVHMAEVLTIRVLPPN